MLVADSNPLVDLAVHNGPVAALLAIILWGGFKKDPWWVFGWVYRDLLDRYTTRGRRLDALYDQSRSAVTTAEVLAKQATAAPAPQVREEGSTP